jgi:hypothetical protein
MTGWAKGLDFATLQTIVEDLPEVIWCFDPLGPFHLTSASYRMDGQSKTHKHLYPDVLQSTKTVSCYSKQQRVSSPPHYQTRPETHSSRRLGSLSASGLQNPFDGRMLLCYSAQLGPQRTSGFWFPSFIVSGGDWCQRTSGFWFPPFVVFGGDRCPFHTFQSTIYKESILRA